MKSNDTRFAIPEDSPNIPPYDQSGGATGGPPSATPSRRNWHRWPRTNVIIAVLLTAVIAQLGIIFTLVHTGNDCGDKSISADLTPGTTNTINGVKVSAISVPLAGNATQQGSVRVTVEKGKYVWIDQIVGQDQITFERLAMENNSTDSAADGARLTTDVGQWLDPGDHSFSAAGFAGGNPQMGDRIITIKVCATPGGVKPPNN